MSLADSEIEMFCLLFFPLGFLKSLTEIDLTLYHTQFAGFLLFCIESFFYYVESFSLSKFF